MTLAQARTPGDVRPPVRAFAHFLRLREGESL